MLRFRTTRCSQRTDHRHTALGLAALAALAAGCSGAPSHTAHAGPSTASGPGGAGSACTYTDADTVTCVAQTASFVYVATLRGLLRYPASGGEPTRFTVAQGLPDNRVYAVAVTTDGTPWVATAAGVARLTTDRFYTAGGTQQPDVGRPTALFALESGNVLLGGAQGIARYDGLQWRRLTNQYQVLAFAPSTERGHVLVATVQSGVLSLGEDALDEFGTSTGAPELLARSVVSTGNGRFWALLQGTTGAKLGYYDGHTWWGYTHASVRGPWLAVVPSRTAQGGAALVTDAGLYDIAEGRGDALVATETGSAQPARHVDLRGEAQPATSTPPTGHGTHADAGAPPPPAGAPPPHNVPGYAPPVDVPSGAAEPGAPRFGLVRDEAAAMGEGTASAFASAGAVFVAREGAGVARLAGASGGASEFRTHDLATVHRALQVATDTRGGTWVVTDDGGAARFDGTRFARASIDPDPAAVPLMVYSRGATIAAVGRVGTNRLRCYRYADNAWQQVTERRVDPGAPGTLDVRFLGVDERGRFWVGVRSVDAQGQPHEHGVALIDGNLPAAVQFFARGPRPGAHHGGRASARRPAGHGGSALTAPDDLSAVEFDPGDGSAWFAGISGATRITPAQGPSAAQVRTYTEADGLSGDIVGDLARGPGGRLYFATPEGLGYWDGAHFQFAIEGARELPHATALAGDVGNNLWGIGPHGVWVFDGAHGRTMDHVPGLAAGVEASDVTVDGDDRVWFATPQGLTVLSQPNSTNASSPTSGGSESGGSEEAGGSSGGGGSESGGATGANSSLGI